MPPPLTLGSLVLPQAQLHSTAASPCRSTHISAPPPPQTQLSQRPLGFPRSYQRAPQTSLYHPPILALLLAMSRPSPPWGAFQRDTSDRESKGIATGDGLRGSWRWHGDTESSKPARNPSLSFRAREARRDAFWQEEEASPFKMPLYCQPASPDHCQSCPATHLLQPPAPLPGRPGHTCPSCSSPGGGRRSGRSTVPPRSPPRLDQRHSGWQTGRKIQWTAPSRQSGLGGLRAQSLLLTEFYLLWGSSCRGRKEKRPLSKIFTFLITINKLDIKQPGWMCLWW